MQTFEQFDRESIRLFPPRSSLRPLGGAREALQYSIGDSELFGSDYRTTREEMRISALSSSVPKPDGSSVSLLIRLHAQASEWWGGFYSRPTVTNYRFRSLFFQAKKRLANCVLFPIFVSRPVRQALALDTLESKNRPFPIRDAEPGAVGVAERKLG
jgi:hypothetical protein